MDSATALYNQLKAAEPFFLLAGLNLIESEEHIMWMAKSIKTIASKVGLPLVFQSSFDKLIEHPPNHFEILEKVKIACNIPIVTDVHESIQCEEVGKVADIIQIPSFLCCQTDLLVATTKTGKIINIKKGQFCAPSVMVNSVEKVRLAGNPNVMVCEREQCLDTTDVVDPKSRHKGKLETKSLLESRDYNTFVNHFIHCLNQSYPCVFVFYVTDPSRGPNWRIVQHAKIFHILFRKPNFIVRHIEEYHIIPSLYLTIKLGFWKRILNLYAGCIATTMSSLNVTKYSDRN
ncbi:hypothetical protein UlMin_017451 [Ulmus minor]